MAFFDLKLVAEGDVEVDFHHTVEDVGLVMGDALNSALGARKRDPPLRLCRNSHG